jgi:hypothetical protein
MNLPDHSPLPTPADRPPFNLRLALDVAGRQSFARIMDLEQFHRPHQRLAARAGESANKMIGMP